MKQNNTNTNSVAKNNNVDNYIADFHYGNKLLQMFKEATAEVANELDIEIKAEFQTDVTRETKGVCLVSETLVCPSGKVKSITGLFTQKMRLFKTNSTEKGVLKGDKRTRVLTILDDIHNRIMFVSYHSDPAAKAKVYVADKIKKMISQDIENNEKDGE